MNGNIELSALLVYLIPSIVCYILGTFIFVRSTNERSRCLSAAIFITAIGFTAELFYVEHDSIHVMSVTCVTLSIFLAYTHIFGIIHTIKLPLQSNLPRVLYSFFVCSLAIYFLTTTIIPHQMTKTFALYSMLISMMWLFIKAKNAATDRNFRLFFAGGIASTTLIMILATLSTMQLLNFASASSMLFVSCLIIIPMAITSVRLNVLPASRKRYEDFMYSSATPLVILDEEKTVLAVNDSGKEMYHIQVNNDFRDYFNYRQHPEMLDQLFELLDETSFTKGFRLDYINDAEDERIVLIDSSKVVRGGKVYYYCMVHEVTVEFKKRHLNEHLASHDMLTGIYNRQYFEEAVKKRLASGEANDCALMICDLNFFKEINDTYGHQTGDNVLIFTAKCWAENLPQPHILARLGGDEFVMFFEGITSKDQFLQKISAACRSFERNIFKQEKLTIEIVPSIGLAFVDEDGTEYEELYHICDERMYEDKRLIKERILSNV